MDVAVLATRRSRLRLDRSTGTRSEQSVRAEVFKAPPTGVFETGHSYESRVTTVPLAWNAKADVSFDQLQLLAMTENHLFERADIPFKVVASASADG